MAHLNIGNIWQMFPSGRRGEQLRKAIKHYNNALKVYSRDTHPTHWAATQHNLGNVRAKLVNTGQSEHLYQAIKHYEKALEVLTRESHDTLWANTQWSLGATWPRYALGSRDQNLTYAIVATKGALTVYDSEAFPHFHPELIRNLQALRQAYISEGYGTAEEFDAIPAAE